MIFILYEELSGQYQERSDWWNLLFTDYEELTEQKQDS
jgi:hypothetical protein